MLASMKTHIGKAALAVVAMSLLLTGCSASKGDAALDACKKAAEEKVGASINIGDIEAANMGDALFEAGIKDERETSDENAMFTAAGEFTYQDGDSEVRKSMICTVKYENGKAGAPDLTIT